MSAYASLPGSFLPPFFSFGGGAPTADKEEEDNKEKLVVENTPQVQPSNNISTPPCSPSTHTKSSSFNNISPSAFKALALSSTEIDCCNTTELSQNRSNPDTTCAPSSSSSTKQPSDIIIAIRSARVDPVTLIKSLTSKGSNIARRTANFMSGASGDTSQNNSVVEKKKGTTTDDNNTAEEVVEEVEEVSVFSSPGLCYDTDSDEEYSFYDYSEDFSTPNNDNDVEDYVYGDTPDDSKSCGSSSDNGDDPSAIEFELSITFQGRKYNATRAFPLFVKLREDLQKEMNSNNDRQHRSRRNCSSVSRSKSPSLKSEGSDDCTDTAAAHNTEKEDERSVSVPELPRVSPENLGHGGGYALSGVARSGFALLQATAQHYCPEMENWLASVVQAFPCSQVLSSFLWEPLSSTTAQWETIGEEVDKGLDNETSTLYDTSSSSSKPPLHNNRSNKTKTSTLQRKTHSSCGSLSSIQESPQEEEPGPEYYGDDW